MQTSLSPSFPSLDSFAKWKKKKRGECGAKGNGFGPPDVELEHYSSYTCSTGLVWTGLNRFQGADAVYRSDQSSRLGLSSLLRPVFSLELSMKYRSGLLHSFESWRSRDSNSKSVACLINILRRNSCLTVFRKVRVRETSGFSIGSLRWRSQVNGHIYWISMKDMTS